MNGLQRRVIATADGSHSIAIPEAGITFHSMHGAIQESRHVFIEAGLNHARDTFPHEPMSILEVGFGTGLNAFLTAIETRNDALPVHYSGIDAYPLEMSMLASLNHAEQLGHEDLFNSIQLAPWNMHVPVHDRFTLHKHAADLSDFSSKEKFHLVYFDAFAPEDQPHLWTEEVFRKIAAHMHAGGALVTYCSKGVVRRAMQAAGWAVQKLAGPMGKREMVRAVKMGA